MGLQVGALLFEITKSCNLSCRHCYTVNFENNGRRTCKDLSLNQIKYIFNKIKRLNIKNLVLTGGEPFLRKDIFEIMDFARSIGFDSITINTNGELLKDPQIIKQIKKRLDVITAIIVSFDGTTVETHDFIRGEGQFNKLIQIFKMISGEFPLGINVTLGKWNYHELNDFIRFYDDFNALYMNFGVFIPIGNGEKMKEHILTKNQIEKLIDFINEKNKEGYNLDLCSVPYSRVKNRDISGYCCDIFTDFLTITTDGDVIPCILYDFKCGSLLDPKIEINEILEHPIAQIFRDSLKLKSQMKGNCRVCREFKVCKGGCHLLTYALKKDIFESDSICPYF